MIFHYGCRCGSSTKSSAQYTIALVQGLSWPNIWSRITSHNAVLDLDPGVYPKLQIYTYITNWSNLPLMCHFQMMYRTLQHCTQRVFRRHKSIEYALGVQFFQAVSLTEIGSTSNDWCYDWLKSRSFDLPSGLKTLRPLSSSKGSSFLELLPLGACTPDCGLVPFEPT